MSSWSGSSRDPLSQLHLWCAESGPGLPRVVRGLLRRAPVHHPRACLGGRGAGALAGPGGPGHRGHGDLDDALHRHARVHHPRPADPLQRAGHHLVHADRRARGGDRDLHRRVQPAGSLAAAAAWRGDHRSRRRQHALHRHGRHPGARLAGLQPGAGRGLGGDRGDRGDRGAVGRAAAGQPVVRHHRLDDHGRRGQQHALHGHGRAERTRRRPRPDGELRVGRQRGGAPAAPHPGPVLPGVRLLDRALPLADRGRDSRGGPADGPARPGPAARTVPAGGQPGLAGW